MSLRFNVRKTHLRQGGLALLALSGLIITALSLAPVSGAYFTDTRSAAVAVTTATLGLSFDGDNGNLDFAFDGLIPGHAQSRTFTIKNTGTITGAVRFVLGAGTEANNRPLNLAALRYSVSGDNFSTGYDGNGGIVELGSLAAGQQKSFRIDALLDATAANEWQGAAVTNVATVTLAQL